MDADVVVIGAGVAGLRCALALEEAGLDVLTVDAGWTVGGRIRTSVIDGYTCDWGLQTVNPFYPAVSRWVDLDALDMKYPMPALLVRRTNGLRLVADPRRVPRALPSMVRSRLISPTELAALAQWAGTGVVEARMLDDEDDTTLLASLDRHHVNGPLRQEVVLPLLYALTGDGSGQTSAAYAKSLLYGILNGTPGVPAAGMQAMPEQLAARLRRPVQVEVHVESVNEVPHGVEIRTWGDTLHARAAVVAVSPEAVSSLVPLRRPQMQGVTTWWFAAQEAPAALPAFALDGRGRIGPVRTAIDMTSFAPSYAPANCHLVAAKTLLDGPDGRAKHSLVLRHLSAIYGVPTDRWEVVAHYELPNALPTHRPPLSDRREARVSDRVYVAGDHMRTGTIHAAMVSGQRAADALLVDLGRPPITPGAQFRGDAS